MGSVTAFSRDSRQRRPQAERTPVAICAAGELWGGVEECVFILARQLPRTGFLPRVLLFYEGPLAAQLRAAGVDVEVMQGGRYDLGAVARVREVLQRERIPLLHAHGYKAAVTAALARVRLRVAVVKTEHGLPEPLE